MTSLYNRTVLADFTRADAGDIDTETLKIQSAIDQLYGMVSALVVGSGVPTYVWLAYADSADGTVNFSHDPANHSYIGIAANKLVESPSDFPEDYAWSLIRGSDAPTLRLVASAQRFDFDAAGNATGASEILFTAEGTNLTTAIDFSAENDSGNDVALTSVDSTHVKLEVANFGDADWVRVVATADGGQVSDSATITCKRETRPFNWRGPWMASVTYMKNDGISYKGSSYIAKVDNLLNKPPTGNAQADANWDLLASSGAVGDPATPDSPPSSTINLTNSSQMVNLRTLANNAGYRGKANATYNFVVPAGVVIQGLTDGGAAIDSGDWPTDLYTITLTLTVQNGGVVRGGGGTGGQAGSIGRAGGVGGNGGDAITCRLPMTVTVDAGGTVQGGGGGGDGGVSTIAGWPRSSYGVAGGGGGGFPNGVPGPSNSGGSPGLPGTLAGGGLGGAPNGFAGGDAGANASNGGLGGYAIRKNGNTVTTTINGTVQGSIG